MNTTDKANSLIRLITSEQRGEVNKQNKFIVASVKQETRPISMADRKGCIKGFLRERQVMIAIILLEGTDDADTFDTPPCCRVFIDSLPCKAQTKIWV
ncbi:hypothetical protein EVAR_41191_1 [Eumeta japonica]|uniref:Uncharacterized protein n=1 Tax=Eumeta variegata TaxID=151549 RepID=A0A4C1WTC8_EUMVA|nr:hypothetical protein EVAR_41191_1 [Eumeta japonica]